MSVRIRGPYWHSAMQTWNIELVRPGSRLRVFTYKDHAEANAAAAMAPADLIATAARRHHRKARGEFVYFIRVDDGPIKIGRARDVKARLRDLQQAHWKPLRLVAATSDLNEKTTHRRFAHLRIRGEWFTAAPDLLEFISKITLVETLVEPIELVEP